jgi:hypothetical protein
MKEETEESIAIEIIRNRIKRSEQTIQNHQGDENVGVRIQAQAKIVMLEEIIRDIEHAIKRLK